MLKYCIVLLIYLSYLLVFIDHPQFFFIRILFNSQFLIILTTSIYYTRIQRFLHPSFERDRSFCVHCVHTSRYWAREFSRSHILFFSFWSVRFYEPDVPSRKNLQSTAQLDKIGTSAPVVTGRPNFERALWYFFSERKTRFRRRDFPGNRAVLSHVCARNKLKTRSLSILIYSGFFRFDA